MGAILSAFRSVAGDQSPSGPYAGFYLDLQSPLPDDTGLELCSQATRVIEDAKGLIRSLHVYKPCTESIRQAISNPTSENENNAWVQLTPSVTVLYRFYDASAKLEQIIPELIKPLCRQSSQPVTTSFIEHESLVKLLAQILNLTMEFDELKMSNPSMQNDFSFYRRTLHRLKQTSNPALLSSIIRDDATNQMSLFYAYPNPMLRMVTEAMTNSVSQYRCDPHLVCEGLACLCAASYTDLTQHSGHSNERALFSLRVMVASAILYDHILPEGVFQRNSSINVPSVINVIGKHQGSHSQNLMNALRYSTKNLNQDTTPKQVRAMLV